MSKSPDTQVKICGLSTVETVKAAVTAGASFVGLMFYDKSPRRVSVTEAANLRPLVPADVNAVAVLVNAENDFIIDMVARVKPDILQLHGQESPARVAEIKALTGLPVMKVLGIGDAADVAASGAYEKVADLLMFDAKPPKSMANALPGGNAVSFDWSLIAHINPECPWMLAGGLTPDNVAEAIRQTGAKIVDVSSGVEDAPGKKNVALISAFIDAAKSAVR